MRECPKSHWPYDGPGAIGSFQKCPECGRSQRIINGYFARGAWITHEMPEEPEPSRVGGVPLVPLEDRPHLGDAF